MQILKIENIDFELIVECNNFQDSFDKASRKQPNLLTSTKYQFTSGILKLLPFDSNGLELIANQESYPVFFENKDYFIGITFKNNLNIVNPSIYSKTKEIEGKFFYRNGINFLSGTINFGNDIGKCDLIIRYFKNDQCKEFIFTFEVFPTKLDYRSDYNCMIADIERVYPYLVLDFLRKTYLSFKTGNSPNTDLIWWQIFGGLFAEFVKASKYILDKPHNRIIRQIRYVKADKIIRMTNRLEEEFCQFKHEPNKIYRSEYRTLSTNTLENRFFKYAIIQTLRKYKKIQDYIISKYSNSITNAFKSELNTIEKRIEVLANNPLFKSIDEFQGLKQESLVLQKATGYSTIYKTWVMLNRGLKFLEGVQKIELKNIADLYQIWCFLEIKEIIQELLGKYGPDDVELAEIVDDFVFKVERGGKSKVSFKQRNELIELFHDFSFEKDGNLNVKSYTVSQRPDIVLKITKNDLRENYDLTYLFDAKYRLASDEDMNNPDVPTEDSINQMHRYRDAIYYVNKELNKPEKEVIGAYVLFPGTGSLSSIENSNYFKSIETVNIGAFPLKPNDNVNRILLLNQLKKCLNLDTESTLNSISPQKLSIYEASNPEILVGIVPSDDHAKCFTKNKTPFYFTGKEKPKFFGYKNLRYFAPYIQTKGITEMYEILKYEIIPRNKIFKPGDFLYDTLHEPNDSTERLVLWLGKKYNISKDNSSYKVSDGIIRHFRYTKLNMVRNPLDNKIEVLKVTP